MASKKLLRILKPSIESGQLFPMGCIFTFLYICIFFRLDHFNISAFLHFFHISAHGWVPYQNSNWRKVELLAKGGIAGDPDTSLLETQTTTISQLLNVTQKYFPKLFPNFAKCDPKLFPKTISQFC